MTLSTVSGAPPRVLLAGLNVKERRSTKGKAEAIAAEEAGCTSTDLLERYCFDGR